MIRARGEAPDWWRRRLTCLAPLSQKGEIVAILWCWEYSRAHALPLVVCLMSNTAQKPDAAAWRGRALISWTLFVVSAGLYFLTRQAAITADGIYFDDMLQRGRLVNHHLLYLPLVWAVQEGLSSVVDVTPELAMKIVSALAGGAGVALTFLLANRALQTPGRSIVAALTMMGLMGYWFHSTATELHALQAASAAVLMLGLLRALDCDGCMDSRTWCLCASGALLVPLSHMSGYAAALPILYVVLRIAATARVALIMALLCGGLGFAAIYGAVYFSDVGLGEAVQFAAEVSATGFSWSTTQGVLIQFSLYALPATTLAPAGLRVLFRTHSVAVVLLVVGDRVARGVPPTHR